MEKIVPLSKSRVIDYSQEKVSNFWLGNSDSQKSTKEPPPAEMLSSFLHSWQSKAEVVCIASAELASPVLVKWCLAMSEKGARIYLLTASRPSGAAQLAGNCLMRFEIPLHGSFLIVNPQNDPAGLFFDCSLTEIALGDHQNEAVEMDSGQSLDAYEFFTYHFWNTAKSEILDRNAKALPCKPAGFSVHKPKDKLADCAEIFGKSEVSHAVFPSSNWNLEFLRSATLVTDFQVENPESIGSENNLMVNSIHEKLHCICNEEKGYLFANAVFGKEDIHYALSLNEKQRQQLVHRISGIAEQADYSFVAEELRQALIGRKIRPLGSLNDRSIAAEATRTMEVQADSFLPLPDLEKLEPTLKDDGITCKVTYQWSILPFSLPKGASEDPLYQKWKDKQTNFTQRISETQKIIDKAEEKSKGFAGNLMRFLKRTIAGKSQKWEELRDSLADLGGMELHLLPDAQRRKIVGQFNEIQKEAANTVVELDQKVEEARQQDEWEAKRKVLVDEVSDLEQQIVASSKEIAQKESEFQAEKQQLREQFAAWLKAKKIAEDDVPKQRSKWEQASGKKRRDKNPKEAEEARAALSELNQLDPSVLDRRHAGDIKGLSQAKQSLETRLQKKKADLEKIGDHFEPRSQSTGGGSVLDGLQGKGGSPSASNLRAFTDDFPEDLPSKGALYVAAGKRYLAISFWQEEEKGNKEADRLKAILCATTENPNSNG